MSWLRRSNTRSERGSVMVEVTLVIPLLTFLVVGTLELGLAWSDAQVVTQGARSGARTISQMSTSELADQQGLLAITATFGQQDIELQQVTIFESGPNGERPAGCLGSVPVSSGESCNIYVGSQLTLATLNDVTKWGCDQSGRTGTHDDNWCPSTSSNRDADQSSATWIGVHVIGTRTWKTGFFGQGTQTISETAVMRMEPRQ